MPNVAEPKSKPSFIKSIIPAAAWLPKYNKKWLSKDVVAGISLTAFSIPESMAYAVIAGLPVQMGLYTSVWIAGVYWFLGTSFRLAAGPTSGLSATLAAGLVLLADAGSDQYIALAALTAIVMGVISILAWLLRLGFVVNFISKPVLVGFAAGAAFYIAAGQLGDLFGIDGGSGGFFSQVGYIVQNIGETNLTALALGLATIVLLLAGERIMPKVPNSLFVMILGIAVVSIAGLYDTVEVVGEIPAGLPSFAVPDVSAGDVLDVVPLALSLFLLGVGEHIGVARTYANKYKRKIDPNQEMLAVGAGNVVSGFGGGYVGAGSMSRSTVNDKAGAQSPAAGLWRAVGLILVLLFLTGLFTNLAYCILAGIVIVAVKSLVDVPEIKRVYAINRREFMVLATTFLIVTGIGLLEGLVVGIVLSLLDMISRASSPRTAVLGRIPGTNRFGDTKRHSDFKQIPGVLVYRVMSELFYANASDVQTEIQDLVEESDEPVKLVVLDMSATPVLDITGADMLKDLADAFDDDDIALKVANATGEVRDAMRADKLSENIAEELKPGEGIEDVIDEWTAQAAP